MILNDIFITNMMLNSIPKINSGYILIDTIYIMLITSIIFCVSDSNFKNKFFDKIESLYNSYNNKNCIVYSSIEKKSSKRFRAIMYFVSKRNDPSVKKLLEITETKFSRKSDDYEELKQNCYRVDQNSNFIIDTNICGKIIYREKQITDDCGKTKYTEIINLEIFSANLKLTQIQDWVEVRLKEYELYIRTKNSNDQLLVEIGYNSKDKDLNINYNPWISNATFENRFFTNKEEILKKIDFFIKNPDWYNKRGLPWTLGLLIWGEPGCGKTGFIKALMNLTKRNGINIKLNDKFDLKKLKDIIYDEEICDDLIIPQDKKIIILEDIDCMGELIRDRDLREKEKRKNKIIIKSSDSDLSDLSDLEDLSPSHKKNKLKAFANSLAAIKDVNDHNNLSYLLNILDGLQECPGRIIIMTTNKPDILDAALTREGRIDYKIEFTKATTIDVKNIIKFYWSETSDEQELKTSIDRIDENINKKFSHATIINMCRNSESVEEMINKLVGS